MDFIRELIKASHKSVENRPEPYGTFHLLFVGLSLLLIITICYFTRKSSDRTFRIVLFSLGTLLLLSEIYKQLYYLYAAGGEGYDWYIFPFQLCSVPMYLSIIVGCMKKSKVRDTICDYLVAIGFLGGIMAYAEPSGILNGYYFTLIHSCIWHALLIFIALYILFTNNGCYKIKDYKRTLLVLAGVVLTATTLNIIFHEKPSFNMCYISPYYNTPLAVFSSFDVLFKNLLGNYVGRIISILIYILALILGGLLIHIVSYYVKEKVCRKKYS